MADLAGNGPLSGWALSPGHAGMEGQAVALLEALDIAPEIKRVAPRAPWAWLPGSSWPLPLLSLPDSGAAIAPPWPDLIVSCGRRAAPFAAHIGAASKGAVRTVHIQDPQSGHGRFDLLLVPEHDRVSGPNVIRTVGSLHRVTRARLDDERAAFAGLYEPLPGPRVAVLIGGPNGRMALDAATLTRLGRELAGAAADRGAGLMITGSRRSDPRALAAFRAEIAHLPHRFWEGEGPNPYFGLLGWADAVVVTGDSINMICEACATGRPVHIAAFQGAGGKFERFYGSIIEGGHARFFDGTLERFDAVPLRETRRAARLVAERLGLPVPVPESPAEHQRGIA